jgi:hypothetical protein
MIVDATALRGFQGILLAIFAALAGACAEEAAPAKGSTMAAAPVEMMRSVEAAPADPVATAEAFIDAFYSFDRDRLAAFLAAAPESAPRLLYYQGWAEGGNYAVLERTPCSLDEDGVVHCPVRVRDDPVVALGTGFNVTDTFHLDFVDGVIVEVETSSNDQPIYYQALEWVEANMPEILDGPCANRDTPEGTPGDCARAMTRGYAAFAASADFPGVPPRPESASGAGVAPQR